MSPTNLKISFWEICLFHYFIFLQLPVLLKDGGIDITQHAQIAILDFVSVAAVMAIVQKPKNILLFENLSSVKPCSKVYYLQILLSRILEDFTIAYNMVAMFTIIWGTLVKVNLNVFGATLISYRTSFTHCCVKNNQVRVVFSILLFNKITALKPIQVWNQFSPCCFFLNVFFPTCVVYVLHWCIAFSFSSFWIVLATVLLWTNKPSTCSLSQV